MLYWLIAGIALLALFLLFGRWFVGANPAVLAYRIRRITGYALAVMAFLFFVSGRLALAVPLAAGAALLLGWRAGAAGGMAGTGPNPSPGNASQVETEWLSMTLDHASGGLDGTVKRGAFNGKRLGELTREQVIELLQECRGSDAQSATLLETYLDRVHGTDWRGSNEQPGGQETPKPPPRDGRMTREEALQMLGLKAGASEAEIKQAHHRLMMKVHPDQGGSDYLAAKLNEAKDLLLG
jgi:hypothetical protein